MVHMLKETHYVLPTTYYPQLTTHYPPPSAHYLLPTTHQVSGAMVHKVKETLRLASLKPLIAAIDHADEAAGEGVRRAPGERPKVARPCSNPDPDPNPNPNPSPNPNLKS